MARIWNKQPRKTGEFLFASAINANFQRSEGEYRILNEKLFRIRRNKRTCHYQSNDNDD